MLRPAIHVLGDIQMFVIAGALANHHSDGCNLSLAEVNTKFLLFSFATND